MGSRPHNSNRPKKSSRPQLRKRADAIDADDSELLPAILGSFADAYAVIVVSLKAVADNEHSGPESVTLRLGVEALDRAYNQLDKAIIEGASA